VTNSLREANEMLIPTFSPQGDGNITKSLVVIPHDDG